MGDLNVIIEEKPGSEIVRWSKKGHINSNWNRGYISLPPDSQKVKCRSWNIDTHVLLVKSI